MKREQLKARLFHLVQVLSEQSDEGYQFNEDLYDTPDDFYKFWANDFLAVMDQVVNELREEYKDITQFTIKRNKN